MTSSASDRRSCSSTTQIVVEIGQPVNTGRPAKHAGPRLSVLSPGRIMDARYHLRSESDMLRDLVLKNRSYRRFVQSEPVPESTLKELVDLARCTPSAGNIQPLKYMLFSDRNDCARIFPTLAWAGYLTEWPGPAEGERPSAYIIILGDTEVRKEFGCDHGIAAQTICLGATERDLGACMIGAIDRKSLRGVLNLPERYEILLVIALGKPAEKVVLEDVGADGGIKYYRDSQDVHHVPKRKLEDLILRF